jgi:hypothetical protein
MNEDISRLVHKLINQTKSQSVINKEHSNQGCIEK